MAAIDLHSHVLPGIDDGAESTADALAMARLAAADGTGTIAATPHVSPRYRTRAAEMSEGVVALNDALSREGIPVRVVAGAEIAPALLPVMDDGEIERLTLGGGPYLLVEAPLRAVGEELEEAVTELIGAGHGVVLAHPERAPSFQRDPARLAALVERGALCSVTAAALTGRFGGHVRAFADRLLEDGLVHNLASDAHDPIGRPPEIWSHVAAAAHRLDGLERQAPWLVEEVPGAVLAGDSLPPRPSAVRTRPSPLRRLWRRFAD
jgi:protein-tyrosine phosphatase